MESKSVLWLKFDNDTSLPYPLTKTEKEKLTLIFNLKTNSPFKKALNCLGLESRTSSKNLITWFEDTAYVNWSFFVTTVSCGTIKIIPSKNGYQMKPNYSLFSLLKLIKTQWKIQNFIENAENSPTDLDHTEAAIQQSLALGLVILALTLRLSSKSQSNLAESLLSMDAAAKKDQATLKLIQSLQVKRTSLSRAWEKLFVKRPNCENPWPGPDFLWGPEDSPPEDIIRWNTNSTNTTQNHTTPDQNFSEPFKWNGIPVCGGNAVGTLFYCKDFSQKSLHNIKTLGTPIVLAFPYAKPESVDFFPYSAALLFAHGGFVSHACTVAREHGIPCITNLGKQFSRWCAENSGQLVEVNATEGKVSLAKF